MKIALLTIWREKNYGAELQAYATIKVLQQLGYDVRMIDIRLSDCSKPNWKGCVTRFISQFGPSHKKFCSFWKEHIPTTNRYKNINEIQANPPEADIYIVGSDQVWTRHAILGTGYRFFLDFVSDEKTKVAYA